MSPLRDAAAVVGIGHSDWVGDNARVRAGEKVHDAYGYAAVAFRDALADSGIDRSMIDGLIVGPTTAYERVGEMLGIDPRWGGQADAGQAIVQACHGDRNRASRKRCARSPNDQRSAAVQYGGASGDERRHFLAYVYHAPWGLDVARRALRAHVPAARRHLAASTEIGSRRA